MAITETQCEEWLKENQPHIDRSTNGVEISYLDRHYIPGQQYPSATYVASGRDLEDAVEKAIRGEATVIPLS